MAFYLSKLYVLKTTPRTRIKRDSNQDYSIPMSPSFHIPPGLTDSVEAGNPPQLRLRGLNWVVHYLPFLAFAGLTLVLLYLEYINPIKGLTLPFFIAPVALILTFVALYRRSRKLHFAPLGTRRPPAYAFHDVKEAAADAGWEIIQQEENSFLQFWTIPTEESEANYGELVTLMFDRGVVYANSINDPNHRFHLYSGGANSDNVSWIETVLEGGVWRYDPERVLSGSQEEGLTEAVQPAASIGTENIRAWKRPIYLPRNSSFWIKALSGFLSVSLTLSAQLVGEVVESSPDTEATTLLCVFLISSLILFLGFIGGFFYSARFPGLLTTSDTATNYQRILQALKESGWHINHEHPLHVIEARIPDTNPNEGEIAFFLFRDHHIFFNLFDSVKNPHPSYKRKKRVGVHRWLQETIDQNRPAQFSAKRFKLRQILMLDTLPVVKWGQEATRSRPSDLVSHNRLRLTGQRYIKLLGLPLKFGTVTLLIVLTILVVAGEMMNSWMSAFLEFLTLCFIIPSTFLTIWRLFRLRLTHIDIHNSSEQLYSYLLMQCEKWKWEINAKATNVFIEAYRYSESPYAEMVTIIFDRNNIWINSIQMLEGYRPTREGNWKPAWYSRKRNRENIEKVRQAIEEFQQQENARPSKENRAPDNISISTQEH